MNFKKIFLLAFVAVSLTATMPACSGGKFVFVTKYDSSIVQKVNQASDLSDAIYSTIATAPDKSYDAHKAQYDILETMLTNLKDQEEGRPKNKAIVYQAGNTLLLMRRYRAEHEAKGTITASMAKVYGSYLRTSFNSWKLSEASLNH